MVIKMMNHYPFEKLIFKQDIQIGESVTFKQGVTYSILHEISSSYMLKYDDNTAFYMPKELSEYFFAFTLDSDEETYRKAIMEEKQIDFPVNQKNHLTKTGGQIIMESEQTSDNIVEEEVTAVGEKVVCQHCGTEFEKTLLEKKNSLDKCLVCGEYFEDFVTCPECNTKIKRAVLENKENKNLCPVCNKRFNETQNEQGEKVSKDWKLEYSKRDIERLHGIALVCQKCESSPTVDIDKFEILTPEKCKLKPREVVECNEPDCHNKLTSDYIVLAEEEEEESASRPICCPTCGSINIKKIGTMKKAGMFAFLGDASAGMISKTFECQHCHYTW